MDFRLQATGHELSVRRLLTLVLAATLTWASCAASVQAAEPKFPAAAQDLLANEARARGDLQTAALKYLDAIAATDDPETAEFALLLLDAIEPHCLADTAALVARLNLAREHWTADPALRFALDERLHRLQAARGLDEQSPALASEASGIVRDWRIIGPFGRYGRAAFSTVFAPEEQIDLAAALEGSAGPVQWRAIPREACSNELRPADWTVSEDGAVYLLAQFRLVEARNLALHATSPLSWRIWLDGQVVHTADRLAREQSVDQRVTITDVPAGWHRLLVKLYDEESDGQFRLRLLAPDLQPAPGIEIAPADAALADIATPYALRDGAPPESMLPRLLAHVNQLPDAPSAHAAAAVVCLAYGLHDEALEYAKRAAQNGRSVETDLLARAELAARHLPLSHRQHAVRVACEKLLASTPEDLTARLHLARIHLERKRYRESLAMVEAALKGHPTAIEALELRARLALEAGWPVEAGRWTAALVERYPDAPIAVETQLHLALRQPRLDLACDASRRLALEFERDRPQRTLQWLETACRLEDAGRRLEVRIDETAGFADTPPIFGLTPGSLRGLGQVFAQIQMFEAAASAYERSIRLLDTDALTWKLLGDARHRLGQERPALEAYRRSLELRPEQHDLRRLVSELSGTEFDFWNDHRRDTRTELATALFMRLSGSTVRVIDQTVLTVLPDGSFLNFTHGLQKILSRGGITDAESVPIFGEMLEVRTILPDGSVLEPVRVPGKEDFTMPALSPGAAVEEKYLQVSDAPFDRSLRFPKWYFRSPSLEEAFLLSEYVVRVPKGYPFVHAARNLGDQVEFRSWEDGDWIVYQWTGRNMPRVEHEPGAPDIDEMLPFVEIGGRRTWEDVNHLLMNAWLGRLRPTQTMQRLAQQTAGEGDARARAGRLHRWVLENISATRNTSGSASEMLALRAGDRDIVLMALLKAAGLEPLLAAVRPPVSVMHEPNWTIPQARHFPLRLVGVELEDGQRLWMDTRHRTLAAGELLEDIAGGTAFLIGFGRGEFVTLPAVAPETYVVQEKRDVTLAAPGQEIRVQGERVVSGSAGHELREDLCGADERRQRQALEDHLGQSVPGVVTHKQTCDARAVPGQPFAQSYEIASDVLARKIGEDRFAVPLLLTPLDLLPESDEDPRDRQTPYHQTLYRVSQDEVIYRLPEGARLLSRPQDTMLRDEFGSYRLQVTEEAGCLIVRRSYEYLPQRIKRADEDERLNGPDAWDRFVELARRIEQLERRPIVWTSGVVE